MWSPKTMYWILPGLLALNLHVLASENLVSIWNDLLLGAVRYANIPPPVAVRQAAIVHLAILESTKKTSKGHFQEPFSIETSISEAAYGCLVTFYPKSSDAFHSHYRAIMATIPNSQAKTNGMLRGRRVVNEILRLRQLDGSGISLAWVSNNSPGCWQRTLPNYDKPLLPNWGKMTPFAISSVEEFRPAGPPPLTSIRWSEQYNLVKQLGATNSTVRTPQQREIAMFWADGAGTETPPGHWNRIAQQVVEKKSFDLVESARLFAALNVAMADSAIVCWDAKYHYNWWRPITAIRAGDTDGNDTTEPDPSWVPLLPTPPFPEHTSGHSTFSGAAAEILAEFTGSDEFSFVTTSDGLPGVVRRFRSFSDAAKEAGISRIYGGIHFPAANEAGLESGKRVGGFVAKKFLADKNN
jgi:hypothetical protein